MILKRIYFAFHFIAPSFGTILIFFFFACEAALQIKLSINARVAIKSSSAGLSVGVCNVPLHL